MKPLTIALPTPDANMLLVGRVVARGWEAEQCRPEALAVRGTASMPEVPLGRGGIATNETNISVRLAL